MPSVFTQRPRSEWIAHNELAFAIRDGFPVSPGHTLVVPFREVATWFEASAEEKVAIFELVDEVKARLDEELPPGRLQRRLQRGRGRRADRACTSTST